MSVDELPLKEWVVIFYPQTGAARLCPNLEFARNTARSPSTFANHVYRNANEFRVRHDHAALEKCWTKAHETASWKMPKTAVGKLEDYSPTPPDCSTELFAKLLWDFIQDVGDRLTAPRLEMGRTKDNYELKLGDIGQLIQDEKAFKQAYNKQARTVLEALYNNGRAFLTEEEIKLVILNLVAHRSLKTKQKPWVVFQYYRPEFIRDGYIIRGRQPRRAGAE